MPIKRTGTTPQQLEKKLDGLGLKIAEGIRDRVAPRTPVDSGALLASLEVHGDDSGASVGYTAEHAIYTELGTREIPPQLYMKNTLDEVPDIIKDILK